MSPCDRETDLYELWQLHASTGLRLRDREGRVIIVVSRGTRNDSAGPDFLDAVLSIDGRINVGAVEMHRHERDWFAHGHDRDAAYRRVILHVVATACVPALLGIPTILASAIEQTSLEARALPGGTALELQTRNNIVGRPSAGEPASPLSTSDTVQISRELLVDCAWTRLLRRTTEVLRCESEFIPVEQLRRSYLRRAFDALGYSRNRAPMRAVIDALLDTSTADRALTFDATAAFLFSVGRCDPKIICALGAGFMSNTRLSSIVATMNTYAPATSVAWDRSTRPANAPERRLWAGALIVVGIERQGWLERIIERIAAGATWHQLEGNIIVRLGSEAFVGRERAAEILMNALLPVALAAGIRANSAQLIERSCQLYRTAPVLSSNRTIRRVESRLLGGRSLTSGYWQQGAIELQQRYLTADRGALSFVADSASFAYRSYSCVA